MKLKSLGQLGLSLFILASCGEPEEKQNTPEIQVPEAELNVIEDDFAWQTEQFADLKLIRYQVPGWEKLNPKQRKLVYYLNQAGLSGRDMMYDQNYRHNLEIRNALEKIYTDYKGDKTNEDWMSFETYLKRIWFSNGIHHHYSMMKFNPEFSKEYFQEISSACSVQLSDEILEVIFNPEVDKKKVELDPKKGLVENSAVNFYGPNVTTDEATAYYESIKDTLDKTPIEYSLNSRLVKNADGSISEETYKVGGLYGKALENVVMWLEKAEAVAETDKQAAALRNLIAYYKTGDLEKWTLFNINWIKATEGDIDFINGFVEVYNDPLGYTGSYETIVQIKDFDASSRMAVFMDNISWFEANSPFMDQHKKEDVVGITYNVVNVAGESGDASPSTPIGVNLPNSNWIRLQGSKSVSLGNIVNAYSKAGGSSILKEFAYDENEIELEEKFGELGDKLHTALHEVVGHASGKIEEGVGSPKETLKSYSSTLEEGRADLVALYFLMDPKLVELGLMESLEVGKAAYDGYIRNGMLVQLNRLDLGADIEEAHMRNRAWISHWVFEKGKNDNVIEEIVKDGKLYYNITDYDKLKALFGELLMEVQRIKSQGDYAAVESLVEGYGVSVDQEVHAQVKERAGKLKTAPYGGFINPIMEPVMNDEDEIIDVKMTYPDDFTAQMLHYSATYGFLK